MVLIRVFLSRNIIYSNWAPHSFPKAISGISWWVGSPKISYCFRVSVNFARGRLVHQCFERQSGLMHLVNSHILPIIRENDIKYFWAMQILRRHLFNIILLHIKLCFKWFFLKSLCSYTQISRSHKLFAVNNSKLDEKFRLVYILFLHPCYEQVFCKGLDVILIISN